MADVYGIADTSAVLELVDDPDARERRLLEAHPDLYAWLLRAEQLAASGMPYPLALRATSNPAELQNLRARFTRMDGGALVPIIRTIGAAARRDAAFRGQRGSA